LVVGFEGEFVSTVRSWGVGYGPSLTLLGAKQRPNPQPCP